jgi:hypothetical protein
MHSEHDLFQFVMPDASPIDAWRLRRPGPADADRIALGDEAALDDGHVMPFTIALSLIETE